jgi:predicted protein tyrosine phosphatase
VTRALFICSHNTLRGPTAAKVFASWPGIKTDSAGLNADGELGLRPEQLALADIVFVMQTEHRAKLIKDFGAYLQDKRVICLNVRETYGSMQPALVHRLEAKAGPFLKRR